MVDRVTVKGMDLPRDIMRRLNLDDFSFLEIQSRRPTPVEFVVSNAMLATLVEHGITLVVAAARHTSLGTPEALQGAEASGVLDICAFSNDVD